MKFNNGLVTNMFFSYDLNIKRKYGYSFSIKIKNIIISFSNDGGYYESEYKLIKTHNELALILGRLCFSYFKIVKKKKAPNKSMTGKSNLNN